MQFRVCNFYEEWKSGRSSRTCLKISGSADGSEELGELEVIIESLMKMSGHIQTGKSLIKREDCLDCVNTQWER